MKRILLFMFASLLFCAMTAAQETTERLTGKKFAFLVGITEYEHPKLQTLAYTVKDVKAWQERLTDIGFEPENMVVLTSDRSVFSPTKKKILDSLKSLMERVGKDDIIICMFSGHGTQNDDGQFFCPQDANLLDLAGSCVSLDEVFDTMKNSPAKFKWLIVDACRNDPTKSTDDGMKSIGKVETVPKGVTALFSCADTEVSFERPELGHGVFTYYLMQGLDGKAADEKGDVTILGLYDYVQKETSGYVKTKMNRSQVPYWNGEFTNFVIRENVNLKKAMEAYRLAQDYRRKKEYTNAAVEIKKAIALLPDKQEFLDEQHIALLTPQLPVVVTPTTTPATVSGSSGTKAGDRKLVTIKGVSYAFRWCPAGTFMMGSPESELGRWGNDEKQHQVTLTRGFWMLETQVTQEMWESVMGGNPSNFKDSVKLPVEQVSWDDCQDYVKTLNALGVAPSGYRFSLPTEAQWEYACRAGTTTALNNGKNVTGWDWEIVCPNLNEVGWYRMNSDLKPHVVSQKTANAWGLYDMHGNVWEWCLDGPRSYPDGSVTDPTGPTTSSDRVLRGGGREFGARSCRSATRNLSDQSNRYDYFGVRLSLVRE